jgi:hypothetical protein
MHPDLQIVDNRKKLKEFIFLPRKVHAGHSNWVPPIYSDEWSFFDPRKNQALTYSDTMLFIAYRNGIPAGRIMGIVNRKYNRLHKESTARFYAFDCFNDKDISHLLLNAVEHWARSKGMKKIIGPFGFSDKDPQGVQILGFEYIPVIATPTNLPYLPALIEQEEYKKEFDCFSYFLKIPHEIPEIYNRISERILQRNNIRLLEFKSRSELKPWIIPVLKLVNQTYNSIYGFLPMEEKEMMELAKKYLFLLNSAYTKIIVNEIYEPIAFIVASPDISRGIIKAEGKIFPFGFIHILSSARNSTQLNLYLGAVKMEFRNLGLTALLGKKIFETAQQNGLLTIDSHLILESNKSMRALLEGLGAQLYKKYRVYGKDLI